MSGEATIPESESLDRRFQAERDHTDAAMEVLGERLSAMDRATSLLDETVNRVPTEVTKEVTHLRELTEEHFASIALQFKERDSRSEREARDSKIALDAALAAQKEAAGEQNKSNMLAIDKSEKATAETITKLAESVKAQNQSLSDKVDDLKERVNGTEGRAQGAGAYRTEARSNLTVVISVVAAIIALGILLLSYEVSRSHVSVTPDQSTVTVTTPATS